MSLSTDPNVSAVHARVAAHFADEDARRMRELDDLIQAAEVEAVKLEPSNHCPYGHRLDGIKRQRGGVRRYCKTCNRKRMRAARRNP
jgi:hypothetical protein